MEIEKDKDVAVVAAAGHEDEPPEEPPTEEQIYDKIENGAGGEDVAADVVALVEGRLRAGVRDGDAVPPGVREALGLLDDAPAAAAVRALARGVLPRMRVGGSGTGSGASQAQAQAHVLAALLAAGVEHKAVARAAASLLAQPDECRNALALVDAAAPHSAAVIAAAAADTPADACRRLCAVAAALGAATDAPADATALRRGTLLCQLAHAARSRCGSPVPAGPLRTALTDCAATLTRLGNGPSTLASAARQAANVVAQMISS